MDAHLIRFKYCTCISMFIKISYQMTYPILITLKLIMTSDWRCHLIIDFNDTISICTSMNKEIFSTPILNQSLSILLGGEKN